MEAVLVSSDCLLHFASYDEFWVFCFFHCGKLKDGCARSCELRKFLGIPPFGKSYIGKFEGRIAA